MLEIRSKWLSNVMSDLKNQEEMNPKSSVCSVC
jgi:hypothetical protein